MPIGPDPVTVTVSSRPDRLPVSFEATPGALVVGALPRAFPVGNRVLAAPSWPSTRSRTFRPSNDTALQAATAAGLSWVVMTPEDAVAPPLASPPLLVEPGLVVSHLDIVSWPYSSRVRQAGWGAPDVRELEDPDVLAALGARTLVPLDFLDRIGPPFAADPPPSGVWLTRPDPDLTNLAPWWDWLDAGVWLPPVGDRVWVDVADPDVLGSADVQQALFRGNSCVTTGPLLVLRVGGIGSGEIVPEEGPHTAEISVGAASPADRVVLVGPDGILAEWSDVRGRLEAATEDSPWWVAIAWWGDDWAVTAPVLGR